LNTPRIFVGYHDSSVLSSTETFEVDDIPAHHPGSFTTIDSDYGRADALLSALRRECSQPGATDQIWRVEISHKSSQPAIRELQPEEVKFLGRKDERIGILPKWFIEEFDKFQRTS
jgi:hypothetical protein